MKGDKRLGEVEVSMAEVKKDIAYIKTSVSKMEIKLDAFIDAANDKFVNKEDHEKTDKNFINDINILKSDVRSMQLNWAKATGVILVIWFVIQLVLKNWGML